MYIQPDSAGGWYHDDKANKAKLLRELDGVVDENRTAPLYLRDSVRFSRVLWYIPDYMRDGGRNNHARKSMGGGLATIRYFMFRQGEQHLQKYRPSVKMRSARGRGAQRFRRSNSVAFSDLEEIKSI